MKAKMLIVEDDENIRNGLEEVLKREGYEVVLGNNGEEAIGKIRDESFDLVLTDLIMPKADGMEVVREVKKVRPNTKVIMMTSFGTIDNAIEAMKRGASDYLMKPLNASDVLARVGAVLEEARFEEKVSNISISLEREAVLKSLANPIRLKVVDLLRKEQKLRLIQIKEKLSIDDPTKLSFHLRELKTAGILVQDENKLYFLSNEGKSVADFIQKLE